MTPFEVAGLALLATCAGVIGGLMVFGLLLAALDAWRRRR